MFENEVADTIPRWCLRLDSPYPVLPARVDEYDSEDARLAATYKSLGTHLFGRYEQSRLPETLKLAFPAVSPQTYGTTIIASPDYQTWVKQKDSEAPSDFAARLGHETRSTAAALKSLDTAAPSSASQGPSPTTAADALALPFDTRYHPLWIARQRRLWLSARSETARASCTLFLFDELADIRASTNTNVNILYCRCDRRDRLHNTAVGILKTWIYQLTQQQPYLTNDLYSFLAEPDSSFLNLENLTVLWALFRNAFKSERPGITYCIIDNLHELEQSDAVALLTLLNRHFALEGCLGTDPPLKVLITSHDQPLSHKYGHIDIDALQNGLLSTDALRETATTTPSSDMSNLDELKACRPMLESLAAYRQSPTLEQLQWYFDRSMEDLKQSITLCHSFIEIGSDGCVKFLESFYHKLFSNPNSSRIVHGKLAKKCLEILSDDFGKIDMEVLEANKSLEKKIGPNLAYAIEHWADHIRLSQDNSVAMLDKLIATFSRNAQTVEKFWLVYLRRFFDPPIEKLPWFPHTSLLHLFAYFGFHGLLQTATKSARWNRFKRYLDTPDSVDKDPLSYAILQGHFETVAFLIRGDAAYNSRHVEYAAGTSLEIANEVFTECARGSLTRAEILSIMWRSVTNGDAELLKRTIEVLNWINNTAFPLTSIDSLMHAIEVGRWELVEPVLAVTRLDSNIEKILHYAATRHEEMILGNMFDDPRVRNAIRTHKLTLINTLTAALEHKCPIMVHYLINPTNMHLTDNLNRTPFQVAARNANPHTICYFLIHDFSFNKGTIEEGVALNLLLHTAGSIIDIKFLSRILERGARMRYDHFGITALHVAAEVGKVKNMQILLQYLLDKEFKEDIEKECTSKHSEQGRVDFTPLGIAVEKGYEDIVELLVVRGASVEARIRGKTLVQVAEEKGFVSVAEVLRAGKKGKGRKR